MPVGKPLGGMRQQYLENLSMMTRMVVKYLEGGADQSQSQLTDGTMDVEE